MSINSKTYGTYPRDNQGKGSESMDANNRQNSRPNETGGSSGGSSSSSKTEQTKASTRKSIFDLFS